MCTKLIKLRLQLDIRIIERDLQLAADAAAGGLAASLPFSPQNGPWWFICDAPAMSSICGVMAAMMLLRPLLFRLVRLQNGRVMSMQPAPWPDPDPVVAAAIRGVYGSRKTEPPLAVTVRDRLGEWLHDEAFAAVFGTRGRPGWSPVALENRTRVVICASSGVRRLASIR